ncbi:hypothetical protein [Nocardioides sp. TF02-7]|uniref:hypothetical protein n=1 Tax=Nocardioides sp. TF02-7 TaxID=2917724 RepID=UPI001F071209|nr:hypothetical protein [Nocardioides sp. TF02-7]UMG92064.1 hypothetical protein MF408_19145 [Nocardioides sp. TF02-7]
MTEPHDPPDHSDRSDRLDVGSVGEEAVKLFGALADLARQHGSEVGTGLGGLAGHAASFAQQVDEHVATDSDECRYCPVCRVVHAVRTTSPEVRTHLRTAASALVQAAAGLLETVPPPGAGDARRGAGVEHIDLDGADDPTVTDRSGGPGSPGRSEGFDDLGTEEEDGDP